MSRAAALLLCAGLFAAPAPAQEPAHDADEPARGGEARVAHAYRGPKYGRHLGSATFRAKRCTKERDFVYYEPEGPGPFPIAIYLPGTLVDEDAPLYHMYLERLAAEGFVAVSVDYGQGSVPCSFYCGCFKAKADCLFDPTAERSLISVVAEITRGDPEQGVVVWGHSQGGYLAMMAGDLNDHIARAVATGATDAAGIYDCVHPDQRGLPSDRLRIVQGEHDEVTRPRQAEDGKKHPGFRRQLTMLTEQPDSCNAPDNWSCFRPNGSGFYIVRDEEPADGKGDHRFWQRDDAKHEDQVDTLDPHYADDPWRPWSLDATIDWLCGMCGNGTCEASETPRSCSMDCADQTEERTASDRTPTALPPG